MGLSWQKWRLGAKARHTKHTLHTAAGTSEGRYQRLSKSKLFRARDAVCAGTRIPEPQTGCSASGVGVREKSDTRENKSKHAFQNGKSTGLRLDGWFAIGCEMGCSIKGNVKRNTSPTTGRGEDSLTSSPCGLGDTFCCDTDLTSSPFGMAFCDATTPIGLRNVASVPVVRCQSGRRRRACALTSVRLSNCTCRFPAYSFHEDARGRE